MKFLCRKIANFFELDRYFLGIHSAFIAKNSLYTANS